MELKKGYKQTEIGVIPEDWEVKEFQDVGVFYKGKGIKKDEVKSEGYPCVRYGELYTLYDNIITTTSSFISKKIADSSFKLNYGDLLFAGSGEKKEEIGKSATILRKDTFAGGDIVVLRPKGIQPKFLGYLSNSDPVIRQKSIHGQGDAVVHIYSSGISKILIPIPSIKEQRAIAQVLSDTDALIQAMEEKLAKKRAIKQGAMQRLLTPGEGWEERKLGEIGSFKNGINKSKNDFGFGYPFVNLMDIFGENSIDGKKGLGLINSNKIERQLYNLKKGDVLFIRSSVKPSGVGLTSLVEEDLSDTVFSGFIIRFRDDGFLDIGFKKYCFYTTDFRNRLMDSSTVSANTNINQVALNQLRLAYPKLREEQTRIATILSDMDLEIEQIEEQLAKYRRVKTGLMQELLTGRIRLV